MARRKTKEDFIKEGEVKYGKNLKCNYTIGERHESFYYL